jgi:hypothetical protein
MDEPLRFRAWVNISPHGKRLLHQVLVNVPADMRSERLVELAGLGVIYEQERYALLTGAPVPASQIPATTSTPPLAAQVSRKDAPGYDFSSLEGQEIPGLTS